MTVEERVSNGVALLDARNAKWRDQIDLSTLDIASLDRCVLGQLYGGFGRGATELNLPTCDTWMYGFDGRDGSPTIRDEYAMLNDEWKLVLSS